MKINDILTEEQKWWLNTTVKSPTPNPNYGPDAGEEHREYFNILIDGKLWKRNGLPVEFDTRETANRARNTISTKYGKIAQVIPSQS